jgi:hypothetical protein
MIIRLEGAAAESVTAARRSIEALARGWGHDIAEAPAQAAAEDRAILGHGEKAADPVSVAALVLSIPSAALAVSDLADRIRKRHRARELVDHARELAARQVTACLISRTRTTEIRTLTPDQLLDLLTDDDPAS